MDQHRELRSMLARIRRRWFALTALRTAGRAGGAAALPLLLAAALARLLAPAGWMLVAVAASALLAAAAAAVYVLLRMPRRPDDCQVARFVEERTGSSGVAPANCDALVSAVEVMEAPDRHPGMFAPLLVGRAVTVLREIDPDEVIAAKALWRSALQAAAGVVLLAGAAVLAGPHLVRAGATAWLAWFPGSIQIEVLTGDVRVRAGQPLRIAAAVRVLGASVVPAAASLVVSANGQQRTVPMVSSPEGFSYTFDSVDRSFQYQVAAGSAASRPYAVTALVPPRVTRIDLTYDYPAFTGLARRAEQDGGDIHAPAGTRVRLVVHADKPVAGGALALSDSGTVPLTPAGAATASADLVLARDDAYRVRLSDRDGLGSVGEVEYFIRLVNDRPPDVRIVRPTADQGITPLEEVAIEARADDDYGIAAFDLVYAVAGRPSRTVPFSRVGGTGVARLGSHLLAAEDLQVQPGDVVTYYARARDVARGKPSAETRSDMFFLEVKPFNEEFVSAQSQSMGGGGAGTPIDSLISAQKEIINATWNLERRSGAGRSAVDVRAVRDAQVELRARAEQMARGVRRGGRGLFVPQQVAAPRQGLPRAATVDPVGEAVEAMGRAVDQLQESRTAAAISHEMAALRGLLQAQAEVRRRQVMQQSASGAGQGGSNRTDRDLSALFDRELQRQQRTNYETARPSSETPERKDADALDRVRELARRQEELARRQRELAAARLDADELKRQLERLTREQQELRQQAEALQQQMTSGAQGAKGKAGQAGSGGESSAGIQRAAEQMREAAGEMERQNTGRAAASSEKAAQALRQLERQMRGGSAAERQRTAGELQLEAQQIAEGQRRIGAEASRLDKESQGAGRATGDALRRLAAESEKLASRVDELQRAAREAERTAPGPAGTKFRDAAQQLEGQQIGQRMRESARDMREGQSAGRDSGAAGKGAPGVPTRGEREQQIARALDGVVNALGGGQDGARRLSGELDRTGEMRDRLNRAEQQLRRAEAQAAARETAAPGSANPTGSGGRPGEVERARQEYARELQRSREALGRLQAEQRHGSGGATPEHHEFSRSAPGNEAFKQDFGSWESLRKEIDLALEKYEAAVSASLVRNPADPRLAGGGSERVPEAYRPVVSRYFEAIAKVNK